MGLLGALVLGGCADRERKEAQALIARVEAIDVQAEVSERRPRLEALEALEVHGDAAKKVKQVCVEGHTALLEAEEGHLEAKGLAAEGLDAAGKLPEATDERLKDLIAASNQAIDRARKLMPECNEDLAALRTRFGKRR